MSVITKPIGIKVMTFFYGKTRKLCKENILAYVPTSSDYQDYPKGDDGWIRYCPITSDETEAKEIAVQWRLTYERQKLVDANFCKKGGPLGIPFDAPPTPAAKKKLDELGVK